MCRWLKFNHLRINIHTIIPYRDECSEWSYEINVQNHVRQWRSGLKISHPITFTLQKITVEQWREVWMWIHTRFTGKYSSEIREHQLVERGFSVRIPITRHSNPSGLMCTETQWPKQNQSHNNSSLERASLCKYNKRPNQKARRGTIGRLTRGR